MTENINQDLIPATEFFEKYRDVSLFFRGYYKYVFSFSGVAEDGTEIVCWYGGNSADIYRYEVSAKHPQKVGDAWDRITATRDGAKIYELLDY
jgi:hypothetical protein